MSIMAIKMFMNFFIQSKKWSKEPNLHCELSIARGFKNFWMKMQLSFMFNLAKILVLISLYNSPSPSMTSFLWMPIIALIILARWNLFENKCEKLLQFDFVYKKQNSEYAFAPFNVPNMAKGISRSHMTCLWLTRRQRTLFGGYLKLKLPSGVCKKTSFSHYLNSYTGTGSFFSFNFLGNINGSSKILEFSRSHTRFMAPQKKCCIFGSYWSQFLSIARIRYG